MIIYFEQILIFWSWVSVCLSVLFFRIARGNAFEKVGIVAGLLLGCCWGLGCCGASATNLFSDTICYWIAAGWTAPNCCLLVDFHSAAALLLDRLLLGWC